MSIFKRVLLVENEPDWQDAIRELLIPPDFDLQVASSFKEAKGKLQESFDLIILNLSLVHQSDYLGVELLDDLGQSPAPCVVLTGSSMPMRGLFERYNVHDVFVKGSTFNISEFLKVIKEAVIQQQKRPRVQAYSKAAEGTKEQQDVVASEAETFTWLHLSDLHFESNPRREYQIGQVVRAMGDDLQRLREEHQGLKPDVVFFTGDLASKAKPGEFAKALKDCLDRVLEKCELQSCNLFIVPGNHDVDWAKTTDLDAGVVQRLYDASQVHALLYDPGWKGYYQQLFQRMEGYQAAIGCVTGLLFDVGALSWGRILETKGGKTVGVIGLNSAWMSASVKGEDGEVDDQGKLVIGEPLIQSALEQVEQEQPEPSIRIALMHHPLSWLQDWDLQGVEQVLKETCRFILHGHVHETNIHFLGAPSPSTMVISAGTLFKKYERRDIYTCLHAYNIVQLDLSNDRGTIYFRHFDPVHQRYGIDDTTFKDVRDGQYSFQYGEDGFRRDNSLR